MPGSVLLVRQRQHIAHGDLVSAAFSPVPPVLGIQLVPLVGCGLTLAEAPQLLVVRHMQPVLQDDDAVVSQLLLETVQLPERAHPFILATETLQALHQHPAIPGPVKDRDPAVAWDLAPEAP